MKKINYLKASGAVLLALYGILLARDVSEYRFLDRVDLISHEAGHMLFSWFGEHLMVMGGTVGQLFVPTAFTAYFFLRRELYSAAVTLFWAGQNLFNISVYIRDARAMDLPLVSLGGGDAIHDWNYMLSGIGLLRHDQAVGTLTYLFGCAVIIASILCCGYLSFQEEQVESE
jgi:putative component of toxin-antitoxin plasmid stabilization module